LQELTAQLGQLVKQHSSGDYTRNNAVPEDIPFGRSRNQRCADLGQSRPTNNESRGSMTGSALSLVILMRDSKDRREKKHLIFAFYSLNFTQGEIRFGR